MKSTRVLWPVVTGITIFLVVLMVLYSFVPRTKEQRCSRKQATKRFFGALLQGKSPTRRTSTSCCNLCVENLTRIDHATQEWALEEKKPKTAIPAREDLQPYLRKWPTCPKGGKYTIGSGDKYPVCSVCGDMLSPAPSAPVSPKRYALLLTGSVLAVLLIFHYCTRP